MARVHAAESPNTYAILVTITLFLKRHAVAMYITSPEITYVSCN